MDRSSIGMFSFKIFFVGLGEGDCDFSDLGGVFGLGVGGCDVG